MKTEPIFDPKLELYFWLERNEPEGRLLLWTGAIPDHALASCTAFPVEDLMDCWTGYEKVIDRRFKFWQETIKADWQV